ncbi:MAG: hypothetical protein K2W96_17905, partial [Gemmataceae bacterium]|nr:hypothetical protein [Gemmataceae bacterium]
KKAKPEKKPSKAGAWIGGTVLGLVLGAGGCVGAWMFGVEPPDALRDMVGTATKPAPKPGPGTGNPGVKPPEEKPVAVVVAERVKTGDTAKITDADLAKLDATKPDELVLRGQVRWDKALMEARGKGLKADAEPVKQALADLDKAVASGNAEALWQRGEIYERIGEIEKARADYEKGLKEAKPEDRERWQAALDGLPPKKVAAAHPLAALLALGFQPPKDAPPKDAPPKDKQPPKEKDPPKDAPLPEPYPAFARAVKLAGEKKWKEAIDAVKEARKRHEERRDAFPRQPVNPRSDPREKGFLAACDEIVKLYSLVQKLSDPGYLALKDADREPLVDAIVAKAEATARAAMLKDVATKLVGDKPAATVDDLAKLIDAERKVAADKVKDLEGVVADNKKAIEGLETKLKDTMGLLETAKGDIAKGLDREKALAATNAMTLAALQQVGDVFKLKVADAKAAPALVKEVQESYRIAQMKDPTGMIRKLEGELALDREKLANRWEPAQMLAHWLPAVAHERANAELAARAMKDVARVEADPKATPEQKAQAAAIAGLILRNQEKYGEAKAALEKASALPQPWKDAVASALREAKDPTAGVADEAEALAAAGKAKKAMELYARAIAAPGGDKGPLHARRGLVALEDALTRVSKKEELIDDEGVLSARKDAEAAVKAGTAEGHYLLGRLAEETDDLPGAEKAYRAAVAASKELDDAGTKYRAALARVLLKQDAGGARPRPVPSPTKTSRLTPAQSLLAALFALELPGDKADVSEAEKLAREILAAGDKVPFSARAQALAVQGLHTQALTTYLDGLLAKGLIAPPHANALRALIKGHPTLARETRNTPDPIAGEKAYGAGLNHFFGKRYAAAEEAFKDAVKNDNGDARYYYYLGLSRLALGNREAMEDFDTAASLERSGRPDKAAVSAGLERVQGAMRRTLNSVRSGATRDKK